MSVYLPDELGQAVREQLPDVNVSAVVQERLRELLGDCDHSRLACSDCGTPLGLVDLQAEAMDRLYTELLYELQPLVDRHGTATGAATVAKRVGLEMGVPSAAVTGLPRPPRARAS